ncbi:MAG: hypothetical protein ABI988_20285 [Nitrospirota bacterium]
MPSSVCQWRVEFAMLPEEVVSLEMATKISEVNFVIVGFLNAMQPDAKNMSTDMMIQILTCFIQIPAQCGRERLD